MTRKEIRALADEFGAAYAAVKAAEAKLAPLADRVKALGAADIDGGSWHVHVSRFDRSTLDSAIVKGFLTPAQIVAATKTTPVTSVTAKVIAAAAVTLKEAA